jgi:hypothetical protein
MKKQNKLTKECKKALENMLVLANQKLERAKEKNSEWDIKHYENDILTIKKQLE